MGQAPNFFQFGVEDGLPSSEVYQATQDQQGYMWFATDRGLVRFNGYEFKIYATNHGLESDVVFGFHTDSKNTTWFYTYSGGIGYLSGDSIVIPSFNKKLKEVLSNMVIGSMYVGDNDTIWLSGSMENKTVKIDPEGKIQLYTTPTEALVHVTQIGNSGIVFGSGVGYDKRKNEQFVSYTKSGTTRTLTLPPLDGYIKSGAQAIESGNNLLCTVHSSVILFRDSLLLSSAELPGRATLSAMEDSDKNTWIGLFDKGVVCYPKGDLSKAPTHWLYPHSVSSIYQSKDGALWFTTLDAGVFYNSGHLVYSSGLSSQDQKEQIIALSVEGGSALVGTKQGNMYRYSRPADNYRKIVSDLGNVQFITQVKGSTFVGNYRKWERDQSEDVYCVVANSVCTNASKDSIWLYGKALKKRIQLPGYVQYLSPLNLSPREVESLAHWKKAVYAGGKNGLYRLNGNWHRQDWVGKEWIVDLASSAEHLFVATKKKGVFICEEGSCWSVSMADGLPTNHIETMVVQNDSVLWLGSKKGVSKLKLNHSLKSVTIVNLDAVDGLISNEVNQLVLDEHRLWVGTNLGVSYFDIRESFLNLSPPKICIDRVMVNGIEVKEKASFTDEAVAFDFHFTGLDYKSMNRLNYTYRLVGLDADWSTTTNRQVRYMLGYGNYSFEVMAQNNSGTWSLEPARYQFEVLPPIWLRWWFIGLAIVLFLLGGVLFVKWRWKSLEKRKDLELQMAHSKHTALTAQLNPHFVFNALNSIHNFIRKNDKQASSKYLVLFSKLIRQILDSSNESLISIAQEIDLLEKYLSLEQLRFKEKMHYQIEVDSAIDQHRWKIPTQIIQPYLENAIWHGIMHKEGVGTIRLSLVKHQQNIVCIIEDDGVGREKASRIKPSGRVHQSKGMQLGRERLELMSAILEQPIEFQITDRTDSMQTVCGTRVVLTLPILKEL